MFVQYFYCSRSSRNNNSGRPSYREESGSDEEKPKVEELPVTLPPSSTTKPSRDEGDEAKVKAKVRKSDEGAPRKRKSTGDAATPAASSETTEAPAPKKKIKRLERSVVTDESKLSTEELMETGTYQRFTRIVEHIFDATEDVDLNAPTDMDGDGDVPQEAMIPKQQLHELCAEAAKLKVSFSFPLLILDFAFK